MSRPAHIAALDWACSQLGHMTVVGRFCTPIKNDSSEQHLDDCDRLLTDLLSHTHVADYSSKLQNHTQPLHAA